MGWVYRVCRHITVITIIIVTVIIVAAIINSTWLGALQVQLSAAVYSLTKLRHHHKCYTLQTGIRHPSRTMRLAYASSAGSVGSPCTFESVFISARSLRDS